MSGLLRSLEERARSGRPLRMGLVGAGKFGTMLLAQARRLRGLSVAAVADISSGRAHDALARAGWPDFGAPPVVVGIDDVLETGAEVVVEATGDPVAGIAHALAAIDAGRHVVMVTVEADVLAGPLLASRARDRGVVYSLAYGDQPALICELVDWARMAGFEVVCAGKGTKYLPSYHAVAPDEVWGFYGIAPEAAQAGGLNGRMFTSFLDGTKSAIEMAAVCNAVGLAPQDGGLGFPPCRAGDLAQVCIPKENGGVLARRGTVEVVSSLERDGRGVSNDLRWGVFVVFEAATDYVASCFGEYGLATDASGRFAALYRPYHLIGLEATVSVLSAGLLGEPTGAPAAFRADVVATSKRDLLAGDELDGEGGYAVHGTLVPAATALATGALPVGLARGVRLARPVCAGEVVRWSDLEAPPTGDAVAVRREMERRFLPTGSDESRPEQRGRAAAPIVAGRDNR